jgi:hypothetical protein
MINRPDQSEGIGMPNISRLIYFPARPILSVLDNKTLRTSIVAAIVGAFALFAAWKAESFQGQVPSDETLVQVFQLHRDQFERLRQMATEDMHQTSYFSESNISVVLPEPRRNEYKRLLQVYRGLSIGVDYDGGVRFIFASVGEAIGPGWAKGIQFVPDNSKQIGTRIDTLDKSSTLPDGVYVRQIAPGWFLFFQRDE